MSRKRLGSLLIALAALDAGSAFGLGLGEITLQSALNEPLRAEIRLRGLDDLGPEQILVRLASSADFERSGVERLYALTEMRFDVETGASGEGVVRLRTEQPVREPYLDFLLEVRWPNGRVLREYTVLLDLPTYSAAPAKPVQAPATRAPARPSVTPRSDGGGAWSGGASYDVKSGDTLWRIASRTRPDGVSVQQMLEALHRDNPEAFVNGDMDRLRAGAVLRIPAELSSGPVEAGQAAPEVSGGTEPAASPSPEQATVESGANDAYLRLAGDNATDGGGSMGGEPGATGGGSAPEDLAAVQESLSAKERENAELASRVKALEEQVRDYQRVVDLKNEGLAAAQSAAASPPAPAAAPAPAPKPAPAPATPEERGFLASVLDNSVVLGAAVAAAFLATLGFLVIRRRVIAARYAPLPSANQRFRSAAKEPSDDIPAPVEPVMPLAPAQPARTATAAPAAPAPVAASPATFVPATVAPRVQPEEPNDPLAEADMLVAYGRHARAVEVLRNALDEDPEQAGLRLKLMEILASRNERIEFLAEYDRILALGTDDDVQAARTLAVETGHRQWLAEIDSPAGAEVAEPVPPPTLQATRSLASAGGEPEPEISTFDLDLHASVLDGGSDAAAPDLDFAGDDVDEPDGDAAGNDDDAVLEDSGFGELELGSLTLDEEPADAATHDVPMEFADLGDSLEMPSGGAQADDDTGTLAFDADDLLELEAPTPGVATPGGDEGEIEQFAGDSADDAEDFDLLEGTDEVETRLELAKAFIDMGDIEGARDILQEVVAEGSESQREAASSLLATLKPA